MSTTRTIIVQVERNSSSYAKLEITDNFLWVRYGNLIGDAQWETVTQETLAIGEYPELATLHDGVGWNPEALWALMGCLNVVDLEVGLISPYGLESVLADYRRITEKQKA